MTTPETLSARLVEDDILSGMFTRFVCYQGTPRTPIAWPEPPDKGEAELISHELANLAAHTKALSRTQPMITPTSQTRSAWEEAYQIFKEQARNAPTPAVGRMLVRIETHVIKTALLFAMLSGHSQIEGEDLGRALALGQYWSQTAIQVANADLGDDTRKVEYKNLAVLDQRPGVGVPVRELHRKLSGRVKAWEFHNALKSLVKLGRLETSSPEDTEKPKFVRTTELDGKGA